MAARRIPISRGRTIVVRPVRPGDEQGLVELYEALDVGDRYLRFFCAYRPSIEFIKNLANPKPREARVVAELRQYSGGHLVAEAGYSVLANGNGEFAMVVAKQWRGWLGPYLLDVVVELAADNGVPNLEAEVLTVNARMLRCRGHRSLPARRHDSGSASRRARHDRAPHADRRPRTPC
jgi:acetyltransferase